MVRKHIEDTIGVRATANRLRCKVVLQSFYVFSSENVGNHKEFIMIKLLVILMLLATEVAYVEDSATEPSTYDSAAEPKESQFDKHPECMNRGTDTSIRPCVVNDAGVVVDKHYRRARYHRDGVRDEVVRVARIACSKGYRDIDCVG